MNVPRLPSTLALLAAALPWLAQAACQVESIEMPVKMVGSRAVATVGINGTPVPLTVDSGAFFSFLTDAAAEQLKLPATRNWGLRVEGITGSVDARVTKVDKLQLFKGDIAGVEFVVGGNEPGAGTMGLMGRNLLAFTDTEYDLANGVIRFHFPGEGCADSVMAYWAGATPVTEVDLLDARSREKTPAIRARVKLNGVDLVALLDTGATTVVTLRGARRAGVAEADMTPAGTIFGAGRGSARSWTARFETFELEGETVRNNRLRVGSFESRDADMLLGIDFFLSHRIYISKARSKMFITYNGGTVFALNRGQDEGRLPTGAEAAASSAAAESADHYARRGAASAARRDYERALADLNRACELEPTAAPYFAQRAAVHEALRQGVKALEDFDKALALDPTLSDARMRRAGLRMRLNQRAGAKDDVDALDKSLAPQAQTRLFMANLYLALGEPAQALAQFDRWLPSHPNENGRESALNGRCWARARLGVELEKALDDCDEAIDIDPKSAAFRDSRGWVHLRLGNQRKAMADFDKSIELRPDSPWSLYGRALTKARSGEAAQAEADFAAARKLLANIDAEVSRAGLPTQKDPKP